MQPVTEGEKAAVAPSLRRAATIMGAWEDRNVALITAVTTEFESVEDAVDTIMAMLVIQEVPGLGGNWNALIRYAAARERHGF